MGRLSEQGPQHREQSGHRYGNRAHQNNSYLSREIKSELSKPYSLFNIILYCKIATKTVPQHASIHLSLYLTRSFSYTIYKAISKTCFLKASKKGKMSKPWGQKAAVNNNMVHVPKLFASNHITVTFFHTNPSQPFPWKQHIHISLSSSYIHTLIICHHSTTCQRDKWHSTYSVHSRSPDSWRYRQWHILRVPVWHRGCPRRWSKSFVLVGRLSLWYKRNGWERKTQGEMKKFCSNIRYR